MRRLVLSLLVMGAFIGPDVEAQSQTQRQAFEVASIKPWKIDPQSREAQILALGLYDPFEGFLNPTGRVSATAVTLTGLITLAYDVPRGRVFGGPDWANSERYIIEATAPQGVMPPGDVNLRYKQLRLMLETLLAERFSLKFHREQKQFPVYALVIARDGPKLQPSTRDCSSLLTGTTQELLCHAFTRDSSSAGATGLAVDIDELAAFLSSRSAGLDRPVVNRTGIQGVFDIKIGPWSPIRIGSQNSVSSLPSPFAVFEQELGLRLQGTSAMLDTIVIESVNHPSEN